MKFNQYLDDYLSDALNDQDELAFLSHVDGCEGCTTELEAARSITDSLRFMPVPAPSAGFADRVLQQAKNISADTVETSSSENCTGEDSIDANGTDANSTGANSIGSKHRRRGFVMGFSSALAAGVVLVGVIALFPGLQTSSLQGFGFEDAGLQEVAKQTTPMAGVTITLDETSQVNLVFDSVAALENAKISIELPPNIALPGYPDLRHVEWRTNLVEGSNLLRLPVVATQLGLEQTLIAHIEYGEHKVTTLEIKLSVVKKRVS